MTMTRISAAGFLLIIFFLSPLTGASPEEKFISSLYHQKRYFDSIGEASRLKKDLSPEFQVEVDYFIMGSYFLGEQFFTVINRSSGRGTPSDRRGALLVARAFIQVRDYQTALSVLAPLSYRGKDDRLDTDLMAARVTAMLHLNRYKGVGEEVKGFRGAAGSWPGYGKFETALARYPSLPFRSPWISAVASGILPGAGQLYCGRYLAAFLSLVSVAAPLAGGVFLLREGKTELAGTMFLFSAVFYGGNIYGAWNAAEYYNRRRADDFRRELGGNLPFYHPMDHLRYPELIEQGVVK